MGDGDRTETAPDAAVAPRGSGPLDRVLGRYRLEGQLGEGGMGVVLAAFDPDLERRVALKILHVGTDAPESRTRLLNEARAMARLTHENVAIVYEVGTASGRDYIAMELIEGETLEDWLQRPRSGRDIIHAFLAAGRGLSAAHSAGVIHRDFKPRNVLRRKDGRIVVTDFGLARDMDADLEPVVAVENDDKQPLNTPSRLAGVTRAGAVLGTPAYMAPEQWAGGAVGPAADQFAFCVALWEAFAGERPFAASKIEPLRRAAVRTRVEQREGVTASTVTAGEDRISPLGLVAAFKRDLSSTLDDSKIPRRLRKILRRGLDPDPAKRWASMDTLLAEITRSERWRVGRTAALVGGALLVSGTAGYVGIVRRHAGESCRPPDIDPSTVWGLRQESNLEELKADDSDVHHGHVTKAFTTDIATWKEIRGTACKSEARVPEHPRLICLDGVMSRLDVASRAAVLMSPSSSFEIGQLLIDPHLCDRPDPPHLVRVIPPKWFAVSLWQLQQSVEEEPADAAARRTLAAASDLEFCSRALARVATLVNSPNGGPLEDLRELEAHAADCYDERVQYDAAYAVAVDAIRHAAPQAEIEKKLAHANELLQRVKQRDLEGDLELLRSLAAAQANNVDEAIKRADAAVDDYAERYRPVSRVRAALQAIRLRQIRASSDDVAAIPKMLDQWRDYVTKELGELDDNILRIQELDAAWTFAMGDVMAFESIGYARPIDHPVRVRGRVVDTSGKPVGGATVAAARHLRGNSIIAGQRDADRRGTRTAADGTFELAEVSPGGTVIAQLLDRRSPPMPVADTVELVLAATSRLEGHVELGAHPAVTVHVAVHETSTAAYELDAPVHADGSFSLDGVPRGRIFIQTVRERAAQPAVSTAIELDVKDPVMTNIRLTAE